MVVSAVTSSPKLAVTLPSDREIALTRDFNAPRHLVFEAWTKREHILQWWAGCDDNTLAVCEMDFRTGGDWRFVVRTSSGQEFLFTGVYREIVAPERLVYTQVFHGVPGALIEALVTVTFEDLGGRTRLKATFLHATKEARDTHLESGVETGVSSSFDRLEQIVHGLFS